MATTFKDMDILRGDTVFQGRVRAALISICVAIMNEAWSTAFHRERSSYASQILNAPDSFVPIFASSVSTDSTVIGDATQAGTVALTTGNVATQAALVTDAHISSAISGQFNSFFRTPA